MRRSLPILYLVVGLAQSPFFTASAHAVVRSNLHHLNTNATCLHMPGDTQWPNDTEWNAFNASIEGGLIAGLPLGHVCHGDDYNSSLCDVLKVQFTQPPVHFADPVSVMSPYWQNNSCSPYAHADSPCVLGNLPSFAVNASGADDVAAAVKFATQRNIRLSIKNTGHDYLGRSNGHGALSVWTHNLKEIVFLNYTSEGYSGPAVRLSSGVQAFEVYQAASEHGLRVTGGFCPTVGIVGGYVQGGGHGPLEGLYGLAADNTLEYEVITGKGEHLVASPTNNSDLYWALSGGGGGTYAVVLSQTTKAHVDGPVAGASLNFTNVGNDNDYWAAIEAWHNHLFIFDQIPGFNSFFGFTNETFVLYHSTLPGGSAGSMEKAMGAFMDEIKGLNISVGLYETGVEPGFYQHLSKYTPDLPYGDYTINSVIGGRLIPRSTVKQDLSSLITVFRNITRPRDPPYRINGIASNVTHARVGNAPQSNAVLPAWRDSLYSLNMDAYMDADASWETISELQAQMNENQNQLKVLTPGGGTYMNEATFDNPTWKWDYYGLNYDKLLEVKDKYDPHSVFHGPASVGSDKWTVAADGRLCTKV